jgi:hypothetical protein
LQAAVEGAENNPNIHKFLAGKLPADKGHLQMGRIRVSLPSSFDAL